MLQATCWPATAPAAMGGHCCRFSSLLPPSQRLHSPTELAQLFSGVISRCDTRSRLGECCSDHTRLSSCTVARLDALLHACSSQSSCSPVRPSLPQELWLQRVEPSREDQLAAGARPRWKTGGHPAHARRRRRRCCWARACPASYLPACTDRPPHAASHEGETDPIKCMSAQSRHHDMLVTP